MKYVLYTPYGIITCRLTLPTYLPPISMESHNSLYGSFPILSKILAVTEGIATLAKFDYHYIFTVINVPYPQAAISEISLPYLFDFVFPQHPHQKLYIDGMDINSDFFLSCFHDEIVLRALIANTLTIIDFPGFHKNAPVHKVIFVFVNINFKY